MTAIYAASSEGKVMSEGYRGLSNVGITFEIPVYTGMPQYACPMPGSGDNIAYLSDLIVAGYNLSPKFSSYTTDYTITVEESVTSVNISAKTVSGSASIAGVGNVKLDPGEDLINLICTSSTGTRQTYTIKVKRKTAEESAAEQEASSDTENPQGTPSAVELTSDTYTLGTQITGVSAGTTRDSLLGGIKVKNGTLKVFDASGAEASGNIGTGFSVKAYDANGKETGSYTIVIKGDNNGDGKVNSADALRTQRHSIGSLSLTGAELAASDVNGDGKFNSADALLMQRFSVGTYSIKW